MFERLERTAAPALGNGQRGRIREDFVFAFFQAIEDASRRGLARGFWYFEPTVHICVDRAQYHRVDTYALAGQECSE